MNIHLGFGEYYSHLYRDRGFQEETVNNILRHLQYFLNWYAMTENFEELNKETLIRFREYLRPKIKVSTINLRLKIVNQFNSFMVEQKINPAKKVKLQEILIPVKQGENLKVATDEELNALERSIRLEGNPRDLLIFKLLNEVGLKSGEILALTKNHFKSVVDVKSNQLHYQLEIHNKGKLRNVLISDEIAGLIQKQISTIPSDNVFIFFGSNNGPLYKDAINQILDKYSELSSVNRIINPQAIRSAYIRRLFDQGLSVKEISEITGLSKHNFYTIYSKFVDPNTRWNVDVEPDALPDDMEDEYGRIIQEGFEDINLHNIEQDEQNKS